jgi:phospholipase/carboxylesterase
MPLMLDGPRLAPLAGGRATSLVVILHGVGANGSDIIHLARFWQRLLPQTEFIAPDAPFPCGYAPFGRQWFSLEDRSPEVLLAGLRDTAPVLASFLDGLLTGRGLDNSCLALAGFSQGAAMALYAGLCRQEQIAGIAAFSGALPPAPALAGDFCSKPPVLLVHGELDAVVPFRSLAVTKAILEHAGVPVKTVVRPGLGHEIDETGARQAADFLSAALKTGQGDFTADA